MPSKPEPAMDELDRLARTVEEEVARAEALTDQADQHSIRAGQAMLAAREQIRAGALGPDVKWESWARHNIGISDSRRRELIRIAEAPDPKAALQASRAASRRRVWKHRARSRSAGQPRQTEAARQLLHDYVEGASIDRVRRILAREFREISPSTQRVRRRMPVARKPRALTEAA